MKKIYFLIYLCCFHFVANAQIQHVEPLNWWVGLKNPNLQLLIHGENISETQPSINYAGVSIKKVNKADSKNYLFLDLVIAKTTKAGSFTINFKKAGKTVYTYNYSLLPKQQASAQMRGFNSSDVIYLITPDRFVNGDYSNDVVAGMKEAKINRGFDGGRHGGDIRGMINSLDYIANMGFTAIWPTPVLENNMSGYSYHGYAITNHYKVDPRYGTLDDYKELSTKARQKGIKLIFDEVLNHTGYGYWWTDDLPFKNWLNYPDTKTSTNHRRTVNQDLYASDYDKEFMKKGWFDRMMPDMNGENPYMANYLIQNTIWWIETLQLGGVRQDTYGYSDKTFLKNWSCAIMNEYPNFSIVGEEWSVNPLITSYWQRGKKNADGYNGCLTSIMDFPLQEALVNALKEKETWGKGLVVLYEALANDFVYADPSNILIMGDNHDMDRIFTQLNEDVDLTKMALGYLLTTRGIPQIYYGTEVLMQNTGHHKVDGLIRSDLPGGWKEDSVNVFTEKGLTEAQKSTKAYLKELLNWRKNNSVIAHGKTLHFAPFDGIYVYFRYDNKKTVMVVMNKNEKEIKLETKRFDEILQNKTSAKNILNNEIQTLKNGLTISPKSTMIFEVF
ncbi:alpha amylase catalytic region [Emticicia oligotrophica DSM 17448]|uniref:Alpha amylase catalytic region n=1 Tax=Emticicia oligotrophica (strain DSM 17448 / CIP 109782 / MTCC 6937 / GPTSA100-15) TaxID=929562 RepID=A0ABM5N3M3_EMTOG|nr:glycoside hydrolase family 13 protein [Emticicia oligotrophica]AFK04047.1 alpha amylase catalytic region [Emticicia oligotrophica DSM 17448]